MSGERTHSLCQRVHHRAQGLEDAILEPCFTSLIPDVLHRLQFRTIGGLRDEATILWDLAGMGGVPTSASDLPHADVVRPCVGDMVEEERPPGGMRVGQN